MIKLTSCRIKNLKCLFWKHLRQAKLVLALTSKLSVSLTRKERVRERKREREKEKERERELDFIKREMNFSEIKILKEAINIISFIKDHW